MHPTLTGIDHVSLIARNPETTVRFYTDALGLRILDDAHGGNRSVSERGTWLGAGQAGFIAITESPDAEAAGALGIGAIHHLALAVGGRDALLKWKRWLQSRDVLVYGPFDQQAYQDLIFTDPDGVLLELATTGPGFGVTQNGEDVYSPPKESMNPYRDEARIDRENWPQPVTEIEPDMTIVGLHHVATVTAELPRTDAFLRDALGLPLVRKTIDSDDPEVERWYWGLDGGRPGTLIAAFPIVHADEGGKPEYGRAGPGVPHHYALNTAGLEELTAWNATLAAAGIAASAMDEGGSQVIAVRDPDGEVVELVATGARHSL
jgi:glyoxalase family protein